MKKWNKTIGPLVFGTALLTLASSCGEKSKHINKEDVSSAQQQNQADQGTFTAELLGVNPSVANNPTGTAEVKVDGDDVTITVQVNGAPVTMHAQHIHDGFSCPQLSDDTNNDSILDNVEAGALSGKILIPLDGDINSQDGGKDNFPNGGSYTYNQSGSYQQMLSDLTSGTSSNPEETKLPAGSTEIGFEGKVIEIHGVPSDTQLPSTVTTSDPSKNPNEELPIACGVLTKSSGDTTGGTGGGTDGGTTTGGKGGGTEETIGTSTDGGTITGGKGGGADGSTSTGGKGDGTDGTIDSSDPNSK